MKRPIVLLIAAALLLSFCSFAAVYGEDYEPGSAGDPIVTKSYVDKVIDGVDRMISDLQNAVSGLNRRVTALETKADAWENEMAGTQSGGTAGSQTGDTSAAEVPGWEVILLEKGKSLIGKTGTQIVLRSGSATALDNGKNGVSDLTGAKDLRSGTSVELNHLLLVPGDDGRGIRSQSTGCYVMVYGDYTIK